MCINRIESVSPPGPIVAARFPVSRGPRYQLFQTASSLATKLVSTCKVEVSSCLLRNKRKQRKKRGGDSYLRDGDNLL